MSERDETPVSLETEPAAEWTAESLSKLKKVPRFITPAVLRGPAGNAYTLLGRFDYLATACGWPKAAIEAVTREATSGDYDDLVATLRGYQRKG